MVDSPTLSRSSLADQIRDHLLSRIVQGELQPGERLVELKIASEMSTSQAPVREALRQLDALGVIETLRNKGARLVFFGNLAGSEVHARQPITPRLSRAC